MKKSILIFSAVLAVLPLLAGAQASLPSAGLTPESPFYFLDRWGEDLRELFTFNPEAKAKLQVEFAGERIAEIKIMVETKGVEAKGITMAQSLLIANVARAADIIQSEKTSGKDVTQFAKNIDDEFFAREKLLTQTFLDAREKLIAEHQNIKTKLIKDAQAAGDTAKVAELTQQLGDIQNQTNDLKDKKDEIKDSFRSEKKKIEQELNQEDQNQSEQDQSDEDQLEQNQEGDQGEFELEQKGEQEESEMEQKGEQGQGKVEKNQKGNNELEQNKQRGKNETKQSGNQENQQKNQEEGNNNNKESAAWNVEIKDGAFFPSMLKIKKGDTVTWTNRDSSPAWPASAFHPTHQVYPGFDALKGINTDESYLFTFDKVGLWKYHNHLNPSVTGSITVE